MSDKKRKSSNLRDCLNFFFSINDINKEKMKININPTGGEVVFTVFRMKSITLDQFTVPLNVFQVDKNKC